MNKSRLSLIAICFSLTANFAHALEYNLGNLGLQLTGESMAGASAPAASDDFLYDYRIRGQASFAVQSGWTLGAVYSIDRLAADSGHFARDAFAYLESDFGRAELGWTSSVASKLGLGLPDVGAMRLNDNSFVYDVAPPQVPVITRPMVTGARYSFRGNLVSAPNKPFQFGASFAPSEPHFNSVADMGVKYRLPYGKTKIAAYAGASFIDSPKGLGTGLYSPRVTADSRSQIALGLNMQYNSWNIGLTARGIYDKNPVGPASDGLQTGAGASYDFLRFSASASYILSDAGIWHEDRDAQTTHTGVLSLRYKFNEYLDIWTSGGIVASPANGQPFIAAGLHGKF